MEEDREIVSPEKYRALLEENRRLLKKTAEQERELTRLRRESTFDPIAGLLKTQGEGRRKILESIQQGRQSGKKMGLIRLDVNDLRPWNKEFGHEKTNEMLSQLGAQLSKWASENQGLAMRYHFKGDELGVLLPVTSKDELAQIALELDEFSLESPGGKISCSFTVGFAYEDEPEVIEIMSGLDKKGDDLSKAGRLFTALSKVADDRERQAERERKE